MRENNTHFTQVPIEMVMEIVEAQIRSEQAAAANQEAQKRILRELAQEVNKKSAARVPIFSLEAEKLS